MKPELDQALCRDFPKLYRDRHGDMTNTSMCWGFPGDGWEPLIRRLSEKLEALIGDSDARASQCKEKFGTLRFYMDGSTEEMEALIKLAENESAKTCEICGAPGTLVGKGWYKTRCETCP
jgi:hypothetical protein